jgi:uncharacterized protein (TIRG00374 family)
VILSILGYYAAFSGLAVLMLVRKGGRMALPLQRIRALSKLADLLAEAPHRLLRDYRLIAKVAVLNSLVFLADAATFWVVLAALGSPAPFSTAFTSFLMAAIATTLGPTPMGLGSFEATAVAMLRMLEIPLEAAVAATLLLRGLTLWLPMLPGLFLTRRLLSRPHR